LTVIAVPRFGPPVDPALRNPRTVALTFDDGPSPYTGAILAVLRHNHVQATFCMLGMQARRYPAAARAVVRDGHQLCDHSRDHRNMARLSTGRARSEITDGQREIHAVTGHTPAIFRFPYGSSNASARHLVAAYRLRKLGWDVDPRDWTRPSAKAITARILAHAHPHCVVLMHDGGGDRSHTAASLDATIKQLRRRGYRFVLA
jgi:peptidoglycan/xylan/chitin deacetylase (PgdA/CDA1 family)